MVREKLKLGREIRITNRSIEPWGKFYANLYVSSVNLIYRFKIKRPLLHTTCL